MHILRPKWLQERIDENFEYARTVKGSVCPFPFNGDRSIDYLFDGSHVSADPSATRTDILSSALVTQQEAIMARKLRILDIGTGAGAFVMGCLSKGHEAVGLTIHNYKEIDKFNRITDQLPEEAYVVGDAHELEAIPSLEGRFDLIVSDNTFVHFPDPLSVLEQALNKLSQNGVFVCDILKTEYVYESGCEPAELLGAIEAAGMNTAGTHYCSYAPEFGRVMVRSCNESPSIRLPIAYRDALGDISAQCLEAEQLALIL